MQSPTPIQLTVVYDNNPYDEELRTDWGFSCLIEGLEKILLFDTGTNGQILLSNMKKLGIHPEEIELILLSHAHRDHTGGLEGILAQNPKIEVWLPEFFPSSFKDSIKEKGSSLVEVESFKKICDRAYTTGVIKGWIKEQSLILETNKGLVVMTGCAHPRIVKILSTAKELLKKDIYLALGGFHLAAFNKAEIEEIIEKFRDLGVKKVGPCHCSGEEARKLFAEEYDEDFIHIGVGKKLTVR